MANATNPAAPAALLARADALVARAVDLAIAGDRDGAIAANREAAALRARAAARPARPTVGRELRNWQRHAAAISITTR